MRLLILTICLMVTFKVLGQTVYSIPFVWSDAELNGDHFAKTSMHIPVKLSGDSSTYYFQFDTGANKSFLYTKGNTDSTLVKRCNNGDSILSNIGLLHLIPISSNSVYKESGKTFIGTIGADFFADKIIEINFPEQRINVLESYDSSKYELMPCKGSLGRPTITLTIDKQEYNFLYDTGSSLFDLWTTKKLWNKWKSPDSPIQEYPISSWGKINSASRAKLYAPIAINQKTSTQLIEIWYNSNKNFKKSFRNARVSGIIGNKPFTNQTIIIDIVNQRIGIKKV
jgi:hypothetical protein